MRLDQASLYDANGNITQRVEVSGTQRITYTQGWDAENRLSVVTNTSTTPNAITRFVYDGDGARVLQVAISGTRVLTTAYASALEVQITSTQRITKTYYRAGSTLIAMRIYTSPTSSALYFLHGDHLGSTSLTLNATGSKIGEMKYYPYGETRYSWGSTPTDRRFTGQRQDSYINLYEMGARWYDPALGRWLSPDTIVPDPANPQSLNRYTYVSNRPLNRIDPSGHRDLDCVAHQGACRKYIANPYVRFSGEWTYAQQETIIYSAKIIEYRVKSSDAIAARREARVDRFEDGSGSYLNFCLICGFDTPGQAWQAVYGTPLIARGGPGVGAETFGNRNGKVNTIEFYDGAFAKGLSLLNNALHEFGHLFAHHVGYVGGVQRPYNDLINTTIRNVAGRQIAGGDVRRDDGYRSAGLPWQQHAGAAGGEDFADMFLNWSLDSFDQDLAGAGSARYRWMNSNMPGWIALAVNGNN